MSNFKKNNKKNKTAQKNYRIESLEPRFLMDAAADDALDHWKAEVDLIAVPSYWNDGANNDSEAKNRYDAYIENKNVNEQIEGLYTKTGDSLRRTTVYDLLDFDKDERLNYFIKLNGETIDSMLKSVKTDLKEKMENIAKTTKITASELENAIGTTIKNNTDTTQSHVKYDDGNGYYDATIRYKNADSTNGKLTIDVGVTFRSHLDDKVYKYGNLTPSYIEYQMTNNVNTTGNDFFVADVHDTDIRIESNFTFAGYAKSLEFSFVLDGDVDNRIDQTSTLKVTTNFREDDLSDAKFGVLKLEKEDISDEDLVYETTWTVFNNKESKVVSDIGADLSYTVKKVKEDFSEGMITEDKYTKTLHSNKGGWTNTQIEKYADFSMGRILEKIQQLSAKLNAIQNGEFYDNNVDFGHLLSTNVHSLVNLSVMFEDVINNPPDTLQDLIERMNASQYKSKTSDSLKITVTNDTITIPFDLTFDKVESDVALAKDWLEELLHAEILENKTVKVKSSATLVFDLVVPLNSPDKANGNNKLQEIGLDKTDDQLGSVIGAKALVANKMDYFYDNKTNLNDYVKKIQDICQNKEYYGIEKILKGVASYALYYDLDSSMANLGVNSNNGMKKFDPSSLTEFKSSVANKCVVLEWNDAYEKICYGKNGDEKENVRTIDGVESAVSTLNVIFARGEIDEALKDLKAVAFDNCIVILLGATKVEVDTSKDSTEIKSKNDQNIKKALAALNEKIAFKNGKDEIAIDTEKLPLKEIWISNELPPQHYNESAQMTITVGCETADIEFDAGYFNPASCVGDIAASLQEMINKKFHWETEDLENGITYKPAQFLVDSFEGRIRFVSLQDYSVDFYDDTFAEWLGFESYISVVDSKLRNHIVTATSESDAKKILMDEVVAASKISLKDTSKKLSDSFELTFVVDNTSKSVKFKKSSFESLKWCADVAEVIQAQLNSAFGWDTDSAKLYVIAHNDKISFKSSRDFAIRTLDENVLEWLGFSWLGSNGYSQHQDDGKTVYELTKYKEIYSEKLDIDNIRNLSYSEFEKITFSIVFDDDRCVTVDLDYKEITRVTILKDLAEYIDRQIVYFHEDGVLVPEVKVSIKNGHLCFSSRKNFTLYFYDIVKADELGFASSVVENETTGRFEIKTVNPTIDYKNVVKTDAIEVTVNVLEGTSSIPKTYSLDLSSFVDSIRSKEIALKECAIEDVLKTIVGKLNAAISAEQKLKDVAEFFDIDKDGVTIVATEKYKESYKIDKIEDINGFTIASLLGLSGQYGTDTENMRGSFFVDASLVDDYLDDSKVPLFKNFNLVITNEIDENQEVVLPVRYGVIGETLTVNMSGEKCTTTIRSAKNTLFRMKNLESPIYVYKLVTGKSSRRHEVSVNTGLIGLENGSGAIAYGGITGSEVKDESNKSEKLENQFSSVGSHFIRYPNNIICNNPNNSFYNYTKGDLYADLYAVCQSWMEDLFGSVEYDWCKAQFPVLGKSVFEIMGLQSKLTELETLFKTDMCCETIQELVAYIAQKTGITVRAEVSESRDSILLGFEWNTKITDKCIELDKLYFNHDNFGLSGLFKTFLNADLTFSAKVILKENKNDCLYHADPDKNFKPTITGSVNFFAKNISADMVVYTVENNVRKETELQVESQSSKESNISFKALIDGDQIKMNLGGTLNLYRYGGYAGVAKISVAQQNDYENNSSWSESSNDAVGALICKKETPRTVVVWKNNGSVTPDKNIQKGDVLLDFTDVNNIELKQTSLFDKLRQTVDGLSDSVRRMQSSLTATVMNDSIRNIPLLGNSIVNIGDSLSFLNNDFVEPFRKYVYKKMDGLNAAVVAQKLYTILGEYILSSADGGLEICGDENNVEWATKKFNRYYKGIQFYEDENEAYWHIRLCTTYSLEKDADFDLGFPGLGLRGEGGVDIALKLVFDFGFGISLKDGAFLLLSNGHDSTLDSVNQKKKSDVMTEGVEQAHVGDDLNLEISITPNAILKGSLGFLAMNAALDQNKFVLNLGLDLNDGRGFKENKVDDWVNDGNAKPVILIKELLSNISTEANLRGELDLGLKMTLGIGGYGTSAPHMDTGLHVGWSSDFGDGFGSLDGVKFDPIVFDCGSFVKNTVGGIIEKVERVIKPIRPLISFLQSEIPVLNKLPAGKVHMTVLDLVKKFGVKKGMNFGFLDDIIEMDNVVKKLSDIANKGLMLSEWTIYENIDKIQGKVDEANTYLTNLSNSVEERVQSKINEINALYEGQKKAARDTCTKAIAEAQKALDQIVNVPQQIEEEIQKAEAAYKLAEQNAITLRNNTIATIDAAIESKIKEAEELINTEIENAKAKVNAEIEKAKAKFNSIAQDCIEKYTLGEEYIKGQVTNVEKFVSEKMESLGIKSSWVNRAEAAYDAISSGALTINDAVDYAKDFVDKKVDQVKSVVNIWDQRTVAEMSSVQTPEFGGNWEFPIIDNPKDEIMKMIMGGHADLVIFDMRPLKFNFDWSKSFPIIGPLCADVGFSFGVDIDLCFGYDTCGVERWAKSHFKNIGALIDGFYVADWDLKTGEDIAEVVFHSGVVAGASVCGRFGVNVGLNLNVNMDFKDPNDDGKIRLSEMAEMLSLNPLDTFDVSASISARAYAYLDVVFYRKEWTLWSSGAFDLFKTASQQDSLATRSGENLIVNVGEYAKENSVAEFKEDGDDDVEVIISDSNTVEIILKNDENEKKRTYKNIKENNLCIYAGEGADKITVSSKGDAGVNVFVYGGNGHDDIDLSGLSLENGCFAMVVGSSGKDTIKGVASGTNYLFGDEGYLAYTPDSDNKKKKTITQAYSYPTEAGETDIIIGLDATNYIFGGAGNDFIIGGSGQNYIFGDYGRLKREKNEFVADRHDLFDEGGDDLIYGGNGNDHIYGGAGADFINALDGNDEIHGGQGNDVIYGGAGDDSIYGDDGTDVIFGDKPFNNQMVIARSDNANEVQLPYNLVPHDLKGMLDASNEFISPFFNVIDEKETKIDTVKTFQFIEKYFEKNFPELLEENNEKAESTESDQNEEAKLKKHVKNFLEDLLEELKSRQKAANQYNGLWGSIRSKQSVPKENSLANGLDYYIDQDTSPTNGSDKIDGGNGADIIFGDDGKNAVNSNREHFSGGDDVIAGGAGNDFIDGDAGSDQIDGGSGMDVIYGGRGDDFIDGGTGNDFVFGDDGLADYEKEIVKEDQWFNKNGVIEGAKDALGKFVDSVGRSFGISNDAKSGKGGGDDTIIAGNDSDFIDGQSGNDTYKVQFMGGDNETVTNVLDSGNDANDKVKVFGTIENDNVFVRASDAGLGVIARAVNANDMSKIERINYWKLYDNDGVEFASVDTGAGSDTIEIDSTLTPTDVNGGDDNDRIQLGVMYSGLPSSLTVTNPLDVYDSSIMHVKDGYLSIGTEHSLSIKGGAGDDIIDVYHTDASLALFGNVGNDTFNINSVVDKKGNGVKNHGQISITGGSVSTGLRSQNGYNYAKNTLNISGLPYGSTYYFDRGRLIASNLDINFNSIKDVYLYGSPEQDMFYLQHKTKLADSCHHIEGNGGFDHLYYGGTLGLSDEAVESIPEGMTDEDIIDIIKSESSEKESEVIKVIVVDENGNDISNRPNLNASGGKVKYGLKLSKKPLLESVTIRVMVPDVSDDDFLRGIRTPLINGTENYIDLVFTESNYSQIQYVTVSVPSRKTLPTTLNTCIYHDVLSASESIEFDSPSVLVWTDPNTYSQVEVDPNYQALVENDPNQHTPIEEFITGANGFMDSMHCKIGDCAYDENNKKYALDVKLNSAFNMNLYKPQNEVVCLNIINATGNELYCKKYNINDLKSLINADGKLTLSWGSEKIDSNADVYISYITSEWSLNDESSVFLRYFISNYDFGSPKFIFDLNVDGKVYSLGNTRDSTEEGYFYKVQGNRLIICSNETGEEISITGRISFAKSSDESSDVWPAFYKDPPFHEAVEMGYGWTGNGFMTYSEIGKKSRLFFIDGRQEQTYVHNSVNCMSSAVIQIPNTTIGNVLHIVLSAEPNNENPIPVTVSWIGSDGWNTITTKDSLFELDIPVTDKFGRVYVYFQSDISDFARFVAVSVKNKT